MFHNRDPHTMPARRRGGFLWKILSMVAGTVGALFWAAQTCPAFPPAPTFTIHGIARDAYGWALRSSDRGTVVIKRNGVIVAEGAIDDTVRADENFHAQLAMDTNAADPYKSGAQSAGAVFSIEVRFPNVTLPVASMKPGNRTVGQPGGDLFLDFSVGVDSDGDGIPDTWEYWQLSELGIGPGDPRWSLATLGTGDFDHDGTSDYVEYLAGTFAILSEDKLSLKIEGFLPDHSAVLLKALLVVDKIYRVEFSSDLQTWTPINLRAGLPTAALATNFTVSDTRETPLYAPILPTDVLRFYRLVLVR